MKKKDKIIVFIPAYNVESTIENVCRRIPKDIVSEIVVINDGSHDNTLKVIKKIGVKYKSHKINKGYGAVQKTGYEYALKLGADIIIMLHSDGQHDPKFIKPLLQKLINGNFDIVLGSRIKSAALAKSQGMPLYKIISNRVLTYLQNKVMGLNLSEYHTGYRAFRREVLLSLPLNKFSDDFVFDQHILLSAKAHGFKIGEIFASYINYDGSTSIGWKRSIKYGLNVLTSLADFLLFRHKYE
jgi:glycosyltransferase involved in cell wall biosynthesis